MKSMVSVQIESVYLFNSLKTLRCLRGSVLSTIKSDEGKLESFSNILYLILPNLSALRLLMGERTTWYYRVSVAIT